MNEQALVKTAVVDIFKRNGYSDPARMTQRDYDYIGEQLQQKSGILISGTTVKRLAFGEFTRLPQIATLNAIANYHDYKTWQDFKAAKMEEEPGKVSSQQPFAKKFNLKYLAIPAVILLLGSLYFFRTPKGMVRNAEKASFSFRKNTSNDIPNSVVFNYNIDGVEADSFFIQQSWDENRRIKIYKNSYTVTDIYYEPGYHIAKLIANDSVIRTVDVSIPTDRWFFYAIDNIANYTSQYIKADSTARNGTLGLNVAQLQENNIEISKDKRYHYVYFPTQLNIPGDNFHYKTRVRMHEVRNSFCPYIEIELYCQRAFISMRSTTKGCAHEAFITFGEQTKKGSDTDLSPISFDVTEWTDIEITVKNKVAVVKINDKEAFSTRFTADTKNLAGLGFISNGLCEVDRVELCALDGRVIYKNEF